MQVKSECMIPDGKHWCASVEFHADKQSETSDDGVVENLGSDEELTSHLDSSPPEDYSTASTYS